MRIPRMHDRVKPMKSCSVFAAAERSYPSRLCRQYKYREALCLWNYHRAAPNLIFIGAEGGSFAKELHRAGMVCQPPPYRNAGRRSLLMCSVIFS